MLIYDKDEDILSMEDIDDKELDSAMIQEVSKGDNLIVTESNDKLESEEMKGDNLTLTESTDKLEIQGDNLSLQEEADTLRQQLTDARMMVQKLQSSLVLQQAKSNSLNSSLQMQLKRNQEVLKNERIHADRRLGEVLAHLLFLEGQLKKEQKQVHIVMQQKDELIKTQQEQIDVLTQTNERLVQAVREAYARKGKNGTILGTLDSCSNESLKENIKGKESKLHKGKFGSMRDRFWHHKSSVDLSEPESNMKKLRNRMFSSHENLSAVGLHKKEFNRDKKCRSIAGYPECSDFFPEIPEGNESKGDHSSSNQQSLLYENGLDLNDDDDDNDGGKKFSDLAFESYGDRTGIMTSVGSMPILSQRDTNADLSPTKERPHSMSSMESLTSPSTKTESSPSSKSPQPNTESNPFKNLKTILKRKGSKTKKNKRSVSISQSPAQEVTVKKHFERYDMS